MAKRSPDEKGTALVQALLRLNEGARDQLKLARSIAARQPVSAAIAEEMESAARALELTAGCISHQVALTFFARLARS